MESYVDILMPPELLEPLWKDIDALEARGCYKEAYQYLRTVTNELNQLRDCKKICVTGILTNLLKGQQNAIIRRTHRPTAGGLLQP